MADLFSTFQAGLSDPAEHAALVTPSDSTDLTTAARALYVGSAGDLKITTRGGETPVLSSVPAGVLPVGAKRVWSTSTTASNIAALW